MVKTNTLIDGIDSKQEISDYDAEVLRLLRQIEQNTRKA